MLRPRFTLRCLAQLELTPPVSPGILDDIEHPLLAAARRQWSVDEPQTERIVAIDDLVLLKCKPNRPIWGAVWEEPAEGVAWIVAAGPRQEGSPKDFYAMLATDCERARKTLNVRGQNGKKTSSLHLLPTQDDRLRLQADAATETLRQANQDVASLISDARSQPGVIVERRALGADLEVLARRNDYDELYVAIAVTGSTSDEVHALILRMAVPDATLDDWTPITDPTELQTTFGRSLRPREAVWYTLLEVPRLGR